MSAFRERPGVPLHDPAVERRPGRRRLLQPQQQRLRRALPPAGRAAAGRRRASSRAFPDDNPPIDADRRRRLLATPSRMPFTPRGMSLDHAVHARQRRGGAGRRRRRARRQVHPPVGGARRRSAGGLDAGPGQRPQPPDDAARTTTPASTSIPGGDVGDQPGRARADQERPGLQRGLAARGGALSRRARRRRAGATCPGCRTTAALHAALPAGTPYGLVGTSSFYKRESFPGCGRRRGPTPSTGSTPSTPPRTARAATGVTQGADAGRYANGDIWAVRLLAMEPNTHRSYGPHGGRAAASSSPATPASACASSARSRCARSTPGGAAGARSRGQSRHQLPRQAFRPTRRSPSRRSTATAWCSTWRRPGTRCGPARCAPTAAAATPTASSRSTFATTAAARPGLPGRRPRGTTTPLLTTRRPGAARRCAVAHVPLVDVEFLRDIRPLLQRSCVSCHTTNATEPARQPGARRPRAGRRPARRLRAPRRRRRGAAGAIRR